MVGLSRTARRPLAASAVVWHDVECAAYDADLELWRELAQAAGGPLLDLGCGTGRVALDLAARGHDVTAVDVDAQLVDELGRRARERGLRVRAHALDARALALGGRYALAIAPMQVLQLMGGRDGRAAALAALRRHLLPGGMLAAALADPLEGLPPGEHVLPPLPDVREVDGWVLQSRPVSLRLEDDGTLAIDRLREAVDPAGALSSSIATVVLDRVTPAQLEREAAEQGLAARGRRRVPERGGWSGATVVCLEAPA